MYRLHAAVSLNSIKAAVGLEELDLGYELVGVDIRKDEQKAKVMLARPAVLRAIKRVEALLPPQA